MSTNDGHFRGYEPRDDQGEPLPARDAEYHPALLNSGSVLSAACVAARLLERFANAGGSRVLPSEAQALITVLQSAFPDLAPAAFDDEVDRMLDWALIERSTELSPISDLNLMRASDIETRRSVAQWAIEQELDLEFEYYDELTHLWPRRRALPLRIEDDTIIMRGRTRDLVIDLELIRWLMPVRREQDSDVAIADVVPLFGASSEEE